MNPTDTQKLARVKAWLNQRIEEAAQCHDGPWKLYDDDHHGFFDVKASDIHIAMMCSGELERNDAAFIASSRTAAPAAYKALLAEIKAHEDHAHTGYGPLSEFCNTRLMTLLTLFPNDL